MEFRPETIAANCFTRNGHQEEWEFTRRIRGLYITGKIHVSSLPSAFRWAVIASGGLLCVELPQVGSSQPKTNS